jgi:Carboxypeptidase regulatory-like domain
MNAFRTPLDMRWFALLLVMALLAGCSSPPKGDQADTALPPADFTELDLAATATTGVIRGLVIDLAINPVSNASITLTPGDLTTRSSATGTFGFDALEPGTYFLRVEKVGSNATQVSAEVVAGVAEPPITKVLLTRNPDTAPYFEALSTEGYMTCGVAVVASSVGCDTSTAEQFGDDVYFLFEFTILPTWTQGELVWQQTQAAGGEFIWQIAEPGTNDYYSGGETTTSPALAFIPTDVLEDNREKILEKGVEYRVFGGPHPACTVPGTYGCGVTLNQRMTVYVHSFYNFLPPEGWRFTNDGDPVPPQ